MTTLWETKKKLTIQSFIAYLILLTFSFLWGREAGIYGLSFGFIMGILKFYLLASTIEKAVKSGPAKARVITVVHYVIRYILTFAILLIAIKRPDMNVIWVLVGLFLIKILILGGNIYDIFKVKAWRNKDGQ